MVHHRNSLNSDRRLNNKRTPHILNSNSSNKDRTLLSTSNQDLLSSHSLEAIPCQRPLRKCLNSDHRPRHIWVVRCRILCKRLLCPLVQALYLPCRTVYLSRRACQSRYLDRAICAVSRRMASILSNLSRSSRTGAGRLLIKLPTRHDITCQARLTDKERGCTPTTAHPGNLCLCHQISGRHPYK